MSASADPLELLERRWFAAQSAHASMLSECIAMREAIEHAEIAWRRAQMRLRELELLRENLGAAIAELDAAHERGIRSAPVARVA